MSARLPFKDPAETKLLKVPFAGELETGITLLSVTPTVTTEAGVDAAPSAILSGSPVINTATHEVLQRITGGLHACDYKLRFLATDSSGLVHLITAVLPVRNP